MYHKELGVRRIVGVVSRHGDGSPDVFQGIIHTVFQKFPFDMPVALGHDIVGPGAALDHIVLHDPTPAEAVVEALVGKLFKRFHSDRRIFRIKLKNHGSKTLGLNCAAAGIQPDKFLLNPG